MITYASSSSYIFGWEDVLKQGPPNGRILFVIYSLPPKRTFSPHKYFLYKTFIVMITSKVSSHVNTRKNQLIFITSCPKNLFLVLYKYPLKHPPPPHWARRLE